MQAMEIVDALGLENYNHHAGQEFQVSKLVQGTPSGVFDAWIRDVWLTGGDQVQEGVGRGYIGSIRRVPLGVEEEILSADLPHESAEDQDGSSKIPSICYRVRKPGPFPLQSHLAMVRFVDVTSTTATTHVVWTVKTEMSTVCNSLYCGGLVRLIFRTALKTLPRSLAKNAAK